MEDNIVVLKFEDVPTPSFKETRGEGYISFGDDNKYPEYLISLLNKSAKHNAIVNTKATYVFGGGMKAEIEDPKAEIFIKVRTKLIKRIIKDLESFGMAYVQAIPTRLGKEFNLHHLSYERVRANKDASIFYYKKDWTDRGEEDKKFPAYKSGMRVSSIIQFCEYRPGNGVYGLPGYLPCVNWIEADIEVSKATLTNAKTGFSASKFINFYNGEPTESMKKSIEGKFKNKFGGATGDKIILGFNADPAKRPTVDDLGASDLTKEDFKAVDTLISTNLYAGHRITNSALFGVPDENHSLGGTSGAELRLSFELFKNTYVAEKKLQAEEIINFLASLAGVQTKIELIDVEPIGYSFSETTLLSAAPRSWILEKLGIDPVKYPDLPINSNPQAEPAKVQTSAEAGVAVNEHVKNLTAKQHQQLLRIIRQYTKQQITKEAATILLKTALGFNDEEIDGLLGSNAQTTDDNFGSDEDVAMLFAAHGEPKNDYEVYTKRKATFKDEGEYSDLSSKIDIIRKDNPKATAASIAKTLNVEEAVIADYISGSSGGNAAGVIGKVPRFKVMYSYEKRPDVTGPAVLPTTRSFCKKLLALDKLYTRSDIQKISSYLGYDVMKRAGGFWNNNGTVEYHCRHGFYSQIVIRKKK